MNLFQILLQSLKAKFTPIVTRFRYYFNPAYWLTLGIEAIRNFFTKGHSAASKPPDTSKNAAICSQRTPPSMLTMAATSDPAANQMETRWIGQAASTTMNATISPNQMYAAKFM